MKKLAFIALAALAMFSCNKEEVIIENEAQPQTLKYVFSVAEKPSFDADTRAVKKSWEEGDKIYLVYDDVMPTKLEDLTILKYNASGEWTVEQESTTAPKDEGGTLDAIYYGNPDPQKLAVDSQWNAFFFDSMAESGKYMYMAIAGIPPEFPAAHGKMFLLNCFFQRFFLTNPVVFLSDPLFFAGCLPTFFPPPGV